MSEQADILQNLDVGLGIAEQESGGLAAYFVKTNQWMRILRGEMDVIYGPKGSGKSALYSLLLSTPPLDSSTVVIAADNPRGAPAFKKVEIDPPTSEIEFVNLWKLYFAALVGNYLVNLSEPKTTLATEVIDLLASEQLIDEDKDTILTRILAWIVRHRPVLQGELSTDPATGAFKAGGRISFDDIPDAGNKKQVSVSKVVEKANSALAELGKIAWIAIDRLDVAFIDNSEVEENALSALFHA